MGALAGLFIAALTVIQLRQQPVAIAGPALNVMVSGSPDPHLLTARAWQAVTSHCGTSASCYHAWNFVAFVAFVIIAIVILKCLHAGWPVVFAAAIAIAASPFASGIVAQPLGGEDLAGLMLIVFGLLGCTNRQFPTFVWVVLPALVMLQMPVDSLIALCFACVCLCRSIRSGSASLLVLAAAAFIQLERGVLSALPGFGLHSTYGPAGLIVFGIVLFVIAPVLLYGARVGLYARMALDVGAAAWALAVTGIALLSAAFLSADPAPQWLLAETAFLAALALALQRAGSRHAAGGAIALGVLAMLTLASFGTVRADLPGIDQDRASEAVALQLGPQFTGRLCVASDEKWRSELGGSALLRLYVPRAQRRYVSKADDCVASPPDPDAVIVQDGTTLNVVNSSGIALLHAWKGSRTGALDVVRPQNRQAKKSPKRGFFSSTVNTPAGALSTLTILAGHNYRFRCVAVRHGSRIGFAATNPLASYPHAGAVRFMVFEDRRLVAQHTLLPEPGRAAPQWIYYESRLAGSGRCEPLEIQVSAPTGNAVGAWVTFAGMSIMKDGDIEHVP